MTVAEKYPMSTKELVDCAMGRLPADLVIHDGKWVCVQTGEIIDHTDIAIIGERIAYVGPDANHTIAAKTKVIHADGGMRFDRELGDGLTDIAITVHDL